MRLRMRMPPQAPATSYVTQATHPVVHQGIARLGKKAEE